MSAIFALWIAFLFGFGCGLFLAAKRNQELRRELESRCELYINDRQLGRTIQSAFEMSESEK